MKRSKVIKSMVKILQKWEACKLEEPCADELLTYFENELLVCPTYLDNWGDFGAIKLDGWEPENE